MSCEKPQFLSIPSIRNSTHLYFPDLLFLEVRESGSLSPGKYRLPGRILDIYDRTVTKP